MNTTPKRKRCGTADTCAAPTPARRGANPPSRPATWLVPLLLLAASASPAFEANAGVLVSNANQPAAGPQVRVGPHPHLPTVYEAGPGFRAGDAPNGYTIESIGIHLAEFDGDDEVRVSLAKEAYAHNGAGALIATLTNPATITNDALNTFTAPAGTTIHSHLRYVVKVEAVSGVFELGTTTSRNEDPGRASEWRIDNVTSRGRNGRWWTESYISRLTVNGHANPSTKPLTAMLEHAPDAHTGGGTFRFRVAFSEPPQPLGYATMRSAFTVTGGTVTRAARTDPRSPDRNQRWNIDVRPDGDADVTLVLGTGPACGGSGAICTDDGRQLSKPLTVTVPGPDEPSQPDDDADEPGDAPLTAAFQALPADHDGNVFDLDLKFSEPIINHYRWIDDAIQVLQGTTGGVRRHTRGQNDRWILRVTPTAADKAVIVTVMSGGTCAGRQSRVLCTADGKVLSESVMAAIHPLVAIRIADASATEGVDDTIDFRVTLDRAATRTVTVDYKTEDGSAKAGEDYTGVDDRLTFEVGEQEKTIEVSLIDDPADEGEETFTMELSDAAGGRIADATATGTISNSDPLQQAWIARLGRTVAFQWLDAVGERLAGRAGTSITLAGERLDAGGDLIEDDPDRERRLGDFGEPDPTGQTQDLSARDALLKSAFEFGGAEPDGTASWGAWGRFSLGRFEAEVDGTRLTGDVTTAMLGADIARDDWLAGIGLTASRGDGPWSMKGDSAAKGEIESTLTAVYPYMRWSATDRLDLWATAGVGSGDLTIRRHEGATHETDLGMQMGAVGARGQVLSPESAGIDLAIKSDALWVHMRSGEVRADAAQGGNLAAAEADVTRVRFALEGSRAFELTAGGTLTPSAEVGIRHDAGDAETGTGLELGGGFTFTRGALELGASARALVAHEASGYREWGASGRIRVNPTGSGRGLSLTLAPVVGADGSEVERLYGLEHTRGLAEDRDFEAERRLEAEVGYGLLAPYRGVWTPYAGLSWAEDGRRTHRVGARWDLAPGAALGLESMRQRGRGDDAASAEVMFRTELRW